MNLILVADITGTILLLLGSALTLITALGMVNLPDLFSRMHAATKPQVFGLLLMTGGLALLLRRTDVTLTLVLVVVFQMITAPIAAHMLGRASYRYTRGEIADLVVDEYSDDIDATSEPSPAS